jgi:hypothetical protein
MKNGTTTFTTMLLVLACFGFLPRTEAVIPAPDGGYPGGNTAEGQSALLSLTTGTFNTAVGLFSLEGNTKGQFNTAVGAGTLLANTGDPASTEGVANTAVGAGALLSNTTGFDNTATGAFALFSNTTGIFNTANGDSTLISNTIGNENTAIGSEALQNNIDGNDNTATGFGVLHSNTSGHDNTATGALALIANNIGAGNTAIGSAALRSNTTGTDNTAVGTQALLSNATGNNNIALGVNAGSNVTTASGTICIGIEGMDISDGCYIGHVFEEPLDPDNLPVAIDVHGKVGTTASSRRFKEDIKPMDNTSEAILALKPVTFHYKTDKNCSPRFGLIAEEVAEVDPNLVARDKAGKPYTVRYDQVNAMLLNEFLKEHRKVQELEKGMATLTAQLKEQATQIQKVSAKVEMNKPTTKVVLNNP